MLVEFVTSPAGPLLSTGFHFKADAIIDTGNSESMQVWIEKLFYVDPLFQKLNNTSKAFQILF